MLNLKIRTLKDLNHNNYKEILQSLNQINSSIYRQIELLKREVWGDFNDKKEPKKSNHVKPKRNDTKYNIKKIIKKMKKDGKSIKDKDIKNYILDNHQFNIYSYKKSIDVKKEFMHNIFNFIMKNQWISTILFFAFGFLIYFFYFRFTTGEVPFITGQEFIYVITTTSAIFILLTISFILSIFFVALLYNHDKENNNFKNEKFYSKSIFIDLVSILLAISVYIMFIYFLEAKFYDTKLYQIIAKDQYRILISFFLIGYFIYFIIIKILLKIIKNEKISILFFIIFIILWLTFCFYLSIKINNELFFIYFIGFAFVVFWIMFIGNETNKKEYIYLLSVGSFILLFGSTILFSSYAFKWLDFGNINYSYISLDKDVKNTIPIKLINKNDLNQYFCIENLSNKNDHNKTDIEIIHDYNKNNTFEYKNTNETKIIEYIPKNCFKFINTNNQAMDIKNKIIKYTFINENNESKTEEKALATPEKYLTYIEEKEDVLIIYNIKALSTLGRFWHLETRGGTRFKVESKFINGSS